MNSAGTGTHSISLTGYAAFTLRAYHARQARLRVIMSLLAVLPTLLFTATYIEEQMTPGDRIELVGKPTSHHDKTPYTFRLTRNARHARFFVQREAKAPLVGMQADCQVEVLINSIWQPPPPPPPLPPPKNSDGTIVGFCGCCEAPISRALLPAGASGVTFKAEAPDLDVPWRVGVTLYRTEGISGDNMELSASDGDEGTVVWSDAIAPLPPDPPSLPW